MSKHKKIIVCVFHTKIKDKITQQSTLKIEKSASTSLIMTKKKVEGASVPPKKQAVQKIEQKPAPLEAPNN